MTRDQIQTIGLEKIKKMSVLMITGYAAIVIAAIIGITAFIVTTYDELTKEKVSSMTSTLNVQLKLNLEAYLSRMETIGTLAYSVDNAYSYDASDPSNDEYEAINTEKQIASDLSSLCLMENFVDYGIVYANNKMGYFVASLLHFHAVSSPKIAATMSPYEPPLAQSHWQAVDTRQAEAELILESHFLQTSQSICQTNAPLAAHSPVKCKVSAVTPAVLPPPSTLPKS